MFYFTIILFCLQKEKFVQAMMAAKYSSHTSFSFQNDLEKCSKTIDPEASNSTKTIQNIVFFHSKLFRQLQRVPKAQTRQLTI